MDSRLEELLTLTESTNTWTDQIISQTEVLLQPSPGEYLSFSLLEYILPLPFPLLGCNCSGLILSNGNSFFSINPITSSNGLLVDVDCSLLDKENH